MGSLGPLELVLIFLLGAILYVASIVWAYRDGERRGRKGLLAAILVAVAAWPLSIIVWLFIRPSADGA